LEDETKRKASNILKAISGIGFIVFLGAALGLAFDLISGGSGTVMLGYLTIAGFVTLLPGAFILLYDLLQKLL